MAHVRAEWIDLWQVCHSLEMWPLGAPTATSVEPPLVVLEPILALLLYVPIGSSLLVLHLCFPIQRCTAGQHRSRVGGAKRAVLRLGSRTADAGITVSGSSFPTT